MGSDRFTALDARDAFYHFLLTKRSQDLFKFNTEEGVYKFLCLVMSQILAGLKGVLAIKDDILVHGNGADHDKNLAACLQRLFDYGIRLRKEKCKFGQTSVKWFGHIFTKQGMSPDPEKVAHIKNWTTPKDKTEVKSFLQTVQFCAPYMRKEGGTPHADVTAPL